VGSRQAGGEKAVPDRETRKERRGEEEEGRGRGRESEGAAREEEQGEPERKQQAEAPGSQKANGIPEP
jgi:hypothetical protein